MKNRFLIILALVTITFSANFWNYPIYILDEAKNAACAMEMDQRGDWVVPTFNGELRTDKPPLHYFFMMIAYRLFGISPFSARLFSVMAGIATTLLIYAFGKKLLPEPAAFIGSLIFISSIQVAIQFHMAVPDPYLIVFSTAALFCFHHALSQNVTRYYYFGYALTALAFLAKGPLAIIIVGVPLFILLILQKKFSISQLRQIKFFEGFVLFLIIVVPWWIAVAIRTNGAWVAGFLFEHNLHRFSSTMEGHKGIPGIAVVSLLISLLPLSLFLPQSMILAWKDRQTNSLLLLSFIVVMVVVTFFSISRTFLPGYLGPCLPFASLILGYYFHHWIIKSKIHFEHWISFLVGALLSMCIPLAGYFMLTSELPENKIAASAFLLFPLFAGGMMSLYFFMKDKIKTMIFVQLYSYLASSLLLFYGILPGLLKANPVTEFAEVAQVGESFAIYKSSNPAFVFHFKKVVPVLGNEQELQQFLARNPTAVVFSKEGNLRELNISDFIVWRKKDLFESSVTVMLKRKSTGFLKDQ